MNRGLSAPLTPARECLERAVHRDVRRSPPVEVDYPPRGGFPTRSAYRCESSLERACGSSECVEIRARFGDGIITVRLVGGERLQPKNVAHRQ
jgi:hypothetical protein